jgi:uncharacterized protein YjbI with pentapeptide repeats
MLQDMTLIMAQNIRVSTNKSIRVEKIIEAYGNGERHFGGIFCDDGKISWNENQPDGIDLKGIDLSGTDLYVNWHHADLRDSYFRGSQLSQSNFRGANLSGADFSGASLCKTKFRGADLSYCYFRGAFVEETEFSNANLSYADLRGAVGIEIAYLDDAIFCETIMPDGSVRNDNCDNQLS